MRRQAPVGFLYKGQFYRCIVTLTLKWVFYDFSFIEEDE